MKLYLLIFLSFAAAQCSAEQTTAERDAEAKQAEAEDEAARKKNPEQINEEYSGKLALYSKEKREEDQESGVVGTFTTAKATHLLKLEAAKTLEDLKPFDGKQCTLQGRIRNAGKYFIVKSVVLSGAEYNYKRRRGGL
jgi:hypothetical protein